MGYDIEPAEDGVAALDLLSAGDAPNLAILDWMMPGLDGPDVCRRFRALHRARYTYLLLLTGRECKEDLVVGLESGADDYLTKPVHRGELTARLQSARRILTLEDRLVEARASWSPSGSGTASNRVPSAGMG